jgi:hypothetical protein
MINFIQESAKAKSKLTSTNFKDQFNVGISIVDIWFYLLNYQKKIHLTKEAIYKNTLDQFSTNNIPY